MRLLLSAAVCGAVGLGTAVYGQGGPVAQEENADRPGPVVPVHREPHHRQVFQFGTTRILDAQIPPGDTTWFHSHEWPVLYVTLSQSQTRSQNLGEDWGGGGGGAARGAAPPAAGGPARGAGPAAGRGGPPRAASIPGYYERPVTHRLQNIGSNLFHFMVVVNETPGDDSTSEAEAGFTGTPELSNRWFRSYRLVLEPGETAAAHQHRTPVALFQVAPGTGLASGPMTFELNEPGQWAFFDAGVNHVIRNTGTTRLELLEIEVRRK